MKKLNLIVDIILIVAFLIIPIAALITGILGYQLKLANYYILPVAFAVLSITSLILKMNISDAVKERSVTVTSLILAPLSVIALVFFLPYYSDLLLMGLFLVTLLCCVNMALTYGKPEVFKFVLLAVAFVVAIPLSFWIMLSSTVVGGPDNTVVDTVKSPDGKYFAEVIDSDQGALGGSTWVDVYENSGFNGFVFEINEKPRRVFSGEYSGELTLDVHWEDNDTLIINNQPYNIK